jgi:NADPH:quinone reductase
VHAVTIVNGELRWLDRADPVPGPTELLVSVRAAGINAADLMQARGLYPPPPGWDPDVPGMEFAGEVAATGDRVTSFAPGDRVMAVVGGGAQAELAIVDESCALSVPDHLDWAEAGGFPEVFTTAYDALFEQCGLAVGERVVVSGAAGGVGTAGIQLAANVGAQVVASARHAHLHADLLDLGAWRAVVPADAPELGPFDVVLELVGAASLDTVAPAIALGGRVAVIGVGGGSRFNLDLLHLMGRRARIHGSTLRARSLADKARLARMVEHRVVPLLGAGRVRVPVAATFSLAGAAEAYEYFAAGGKLGKVVLVAGE